MKYFILILAIRQPIRPSFRTYAGHPHALGEKETPQSGY